jgi:hypothetical protein
MAAAGFSLRSIEYWHMVCGCEIRYTKCPFQDEMTLFGMIVELTSSVAVPSKRRFLHGKT